MTLNATPATRDITIVAGDHLDVTIPLTDEDGNDVSLSGWSVASERRGGDSDSLMTVSISGSSIKISATPSETSIWPELNVYDVRLTSPDETQRVTPVSGSLTVLPAITD